MNFVPKALQETADVSRGSFCVRGWIKTALSGVIILGMLYMIVNVGVDLLVKHLPEETETRWFTWLYQPATTQDAEDLARASRVFEQLLSSANLRPLPYQLFRLDLDLPNAIAVPGGGVGITRSMLEYLNNDIGLAMVLAHELGHHQHRHGLRRFGQAVIWRTLLSLGTEGEVSGLEVALQASIAGYSRQQEREADRFGLQLVHRAYGHANGALAFFERLHADSHLHQSRWAGLMSSHPLSSERLADLRQLQKRLAAERLPSDHHGSLRRPVTLPAALSF